MKWLQKIKFAFQLHKSIPVVFRFLTSKKITLRKKILLAGLLVGYVVLPSDIITDAIPLVGWLDDITVISFIVDSMRKQTEK